jgi:hypothetical protein
MGIWNGICKHCGDKILYRANDPNNPMHTLKPKLPPNGKPMGCRRCGGWAQYRSADLKFEN